MPKETTLTWVLEREVFSDDHEGLRLAAESAGQDVVNWDDLWWSNGAWPRLPERPVIFHGSLGNADRVRSDLPWNPGAYCNTDAFSCAAWYPQVSKSLLNQRHTFTTVRRFTEDPVSHFEELACANAIFVRPDSALKPFSGRRLTREEVSPAKLDHGFYYDDLDLPIVLALPQEVQREWRLVMVDGAAVTGTSYLAESRTGESSRLPAEVQDFAEQVAGSIDVGDPVYILDVCETNEGLRLLELNPFSGADLYLCNRRAIVESVSQIARQS